MGSAKSGRVVGNGSYPETGFEEVESHFLEADFWTVSSNFVALPQPSQSMLAE
jgi:hypothetical protein